MSVPELLELDYVVGQLEGAAERHANYHVRLSAALAHHVRDLRDRVARLEANEQQQATAKREAGR